MKDSSASRRFLKHFLEIQKKTGLTPIGPRENTRGEKEFVWLVQDPERYGDNLAQTLKDATPAAYGDHKIVALVP